MLSQLRRVLGLMAVGVLAAGFTAGAEAQDDKKEDKKVDPLTAHTIMHEGHMGKKSLLNVIKAGVKDEKWDDIEKPAKRVKEFGAALGKVKPEKGSDESWKKLTAEYKKTTAAIAEGVEKKDQKKSNDALGKMFKSCKACHDEHKGD